MVRFGEKGVVTYAGHEWDCPRGHDGPWRGTGDEVLEERTSTGDLDGVGAVVLGEDTLHVLDVWLEWMGVVSYWVSSVSVSVCVSVSWANKAGQQNDHSHSQFAFSGASTLSMSMLLRPWEVLERDAASAKPSFRKHQA